MEKYLNFLKNNCKLTNAYYTIKEDNSEKENYKLRSFNSDENEKVYKTLFNVTTEIINGETSWNYGETSWRTVLEPQSVQKEKIKSIDAIWKHFHRIYQVIKNRK